MEATRKGIVAALAALAVLLVASSGGWAAPDWQWSNVQVAIPDRTQGTGEMHPVTSTIDIPSPGEGYVVYDVDVQLNITHPYDADLDVYLIHPDGTRIELFTDVGINVANFTDTILDDEAATLISQGTAPFTGAYRPEGNLAALDFDAANWKAAAGEWKLEITDDATGGAGTLQSWALRITSGPPRPRVTNVTSAAANGCHGAGAIVDIQVVFTVPVCVTGTPRLELETGSPDRMADYLSGSGTNTLTFRYVVQPGDTSGDLCHKSLTLNGGTILDCTSGADALLDLPDCGTPGSLSSNKNLIIDTQAPAVVSGPIPPGVGRLNPSGQYANAASVTWQVTFTEGVSGVDLTDFVVTVLSGNITGCAPTTITPQGNSVYNVTVNTGTGDGEIRLDVLANGTIVDCANNALAAAHTGDQTYLVDKTAPTVLRVTSTTANGCYNQGDVIAIQVVCSEDTIVTGAPLLELETGSPDRQAGYYLGSGTPTLSFSYQVQAGDASPDLDYTSVNALTLNLGTMRDRAGNNLNRLLPPPITPGSGSLGDNKNLVIDTAPPNAPSAPDLSADDDTAGDSNSDNRTSKTTGLTFTGTAEANSTVTLWEGTTPLGTDVAEDGIYTFDNIDLGEGLHSLEATSTDCAGNASARSVALSLTIDITPPASAGLALAGTQATEVISVPFTRSDALSGVSHTDLWYRRSLPGGGAWGDWAAYGSFAASPAQFDSSTTGGDGDYEFYTIATDIAGNVEAAPSTADCSTTIDTGGIAAPIVDPEPQFSPGTSNEITWTSPSGATMCQAQCAGDQSFASIIQDTGWQARPPDSHIFDGLEIGQEYFFRVRARAQLAEPVYGTWSQTSRDDWATDVRSGVDIDASPGDVQLAAQGGPPVANTLGSPSTSFSGGARYRLNCFNCTSTRTLNKIETWLGISASTQLTFVVYEGATQAGLYTQKLSKPVTSGTGTGFQSSGDISVELTAGKYYLIGAGWSGTAVYYTGGSHPTTVEFGNSVASYGGSTYPPPATITGTNSTLCHHHRLTTTGTAGYVPAGSITTTEIAPIPWAAWGNLTFAADTSAPDTAVTVNVLDASGQELLHDVAPGTSLAGISGSSIKLQAVLTSAGANTPKLSEWSIGYTQSDTVFAQSPWATVSSTQAAIYGLAGKAVGDPTVASISLPATFTAWGRVTAVETDSFTLDNGAAEVKVMARGHSLLVDDYAAATGCLNATTTPWTLTCETRAVRKLN